MILRCCRHVITTLAIMGTVGGFTSLAEAFEDDIFTRSQERAIDARTQDYILTHPEVIIEALQVWEERQRLAEEKRLRIPWAAPFRDVLGRPRATASA